MVMPSYDQCSIMIQETFPFAAVKSGGAVNHAWKSWAETIDNTNIAA